MEEKQENRDAAAEKSRLDVDDLIFTGEAMCVSDR